MPEIGEVARAVHYLRKHLVGRTLQKVTAIEDANVFGKVGTSHTEIMKKLTGKKVVGAGQQGKYFWMEMSTPPHPVMHFGMAGWLKFKSEHTFYYRKKDDEDEQWPPKYWKVIFETDGKGDEKIEAAYVDLRRFGRVRLVDCPGKDIRQHSPLVENGPDPVQDKDKVTVEWLTEICQRKKVPIKAMLLDQANISGIGNWVGDEIMYDAKMHPEQYANTLSKEQIAQLYKSIHYVCGTAVDLLSDSDRFPDSWLFKHRWGKGKKDAPATLPNGEKIVFLTVGGRTSAVIPSVQKKTGPVAKEMSDAEEEDKPKKAKVKVTKDKNTATSKDATSKDATTKTRGKKRVKEEEESEIEDKPAAKKRSGRKGPHIQAEEKATAPATNGRSRKASSALTARGKNNKTKEVKAEADLPDKNTQEDAKLKSRHKKDKDTTNDNAPQQEEGKGRRRSSRINR